MPQKSTKTTKVIFMACVFCASLWLLACVVCAQTVATKKPVLVDPNKFALIINGAGGEPAYAKQFEEWTTQLSAALSERFGFDSKQIKILTEKQATAEEVK